MDSEALTAEPRLRTSQLPSLTGLRWLGALLVFGLHVHVAGYFSGSAAHVMSRLFEGGRTGVSFFFVLSGFILMWSSPPGDRATRFWRRRFARLYPVHVATGLLALGMAYGFVPGMRPSIAKLLANVFLVQAWNRHWAQSMNPVSWSLACEAFFYAMFPLLAWLLRRCPAWLTAAIAILSVIFVMTLPTINRTHIFWDIYYDPLARFPEFILGAAMARLVILDRYRGPGQILATAIAAVGYWYAPHFRIDYAGTTVIGFALMVAAGARADMGGSRSVWRHPVLVRLGELSFAFYMVHLLVLRTGEHLFKPHPHLPLIPALAAAAIATTCSLTAAWLLYIGVEVPARRFLLRPRRRPPVPARRSEPAASVSDR